MQVQNRKASDIYNKQNVIIHKAMAASGYPYAAYKEMWMGLLVEVRGQGSAVSGLSDLTLAERQQVIRHFQKKGMKLFSPSVSVKIKDWKKGDPDIEYELREEKDPQVRMVLAMWAEMGYEPKTLRGLCFKMFKKDDPRWLSDAQLRRLVTVVQYKAQKKGMGVYYKRG